jgi:hypothetical protein
MDYNSMPYTSFLSNFVRTYELFCGCNLDGQMNIATEHIMLQVMTAEDRFKLAMSEMVLWIGGKLNKRCLDDQTW